MPIIVDEVEDKPSAPAPLIACLTKGHEAQMAGSLDQAEKSYVAALRMDPECGMALHNLSIIQGDRGNFAAAIAFARRALASFGGQPQLMANMGAVLTRMEHYEAAVQVFEELTRRDPSDHQFWHNLALALTPSDSERAAECLARASAIRPNEARLLRDSGLIKLKMRRWREGFCDWSTSLVGHDLAASTSVPVWAGEPLDGKTIVVYHEQGFGDTIQFCRFLPLLRDRGARVIHAVPAPLYRLMTDAAIVDEVVDFGEPPPLTDYQAPLMGVFAYADIDGCDLWDRYPYLNGPGRGPTIRVASSTRLKVGICWAGNPDYATDRLRSMPIEMIASIADIPGVQLVSLQKGEAAKDLSRKGLAGLVHDPAPLVGDFADLAHVIEQLDAVVSVDSAPLHLAGAIGIPTIGLLPFNSCWRWGMEGATTPFYPSVELVRQIRPGAWEGAMAEVREKLAIILNG